MAYYRIKGSSVPSKVLRQIVMNARVDSPDRIELNKGSSVPGGIYAIWY